jgi:hypothetical protein
LAGGETGSGEEAEESGDQAADEDTGLLADVVQEEVEAIRFDDWVGSDGNFLAVVVAVSVAVRFRRVGSVDIDLICVG